MTAAQVQARMTWTGYQSSSTGGSASGNPTWSAPVVVMHYTEQVRRRKVVGDVEQQVQVDLVTTLFALKRGDRFWPQGADQTDATQASRVGEVATSEDRWSDLVIYEAELEG